MTSQDLLPPEADFDLNYLHQCLVITSAIVLNSPEDRRTFAENHMECFEALVNTIIAVGVLGLTLNDSRAQAGTYLPVLYLEYLAEASHSLALFE